MSEIIQKRTLPRQPLREQLSKPGSLALGLVGVLLALVTIFVAPGWQVPGQWLVTVAIILLSYVWVSNAAIRDTLKVLIEEEGRSFALTQRAEQAEKQNLALQEPKVLQAMVSTAPVEETILLLQPNRLFGQSMLVSIYLEDARGFELLVAEGRVSNVQSNGLLQITVTSWEASHGDTKRRVMGQESDTLTRLLIRPAPTVRHDQESEADVVMRWLTKRSVEGAAIND